MNKLKKVADVAKELGISDKVMRRAIHKGHLRAAQIGAATSPYLLDQADVEAWLESRTVKRRAW